MKFSCASMVGLKSSNEWSKVYKNDNNMINDRVQRYGSKVINRLIVGDLFCETSFAIWTFRVWTSKDVSLFSLILCESVSTMFWISNWTRKSKNSKPKIENKNPYDLNSHVYFGFSSKRAYLLRKSSSFLCGVLYPFLACGRCSL